MFKKILKFEEALAAFTGAPYAITTDCCTHAIELCLIYKNIKKCKFTAYTYLSVIQLMHKLNISYELVDSNWIGEYPFLNTPIWDSARLLCPGMYRPGHMQCLSFGFTKPLNNGRGGAILLDDRNAYEELIRMRYDGRDLNISPWVEQKEFKLGYHYKLNPEECDSALLRLNSYIQQGNFSPIKVQYPDCRGIKIV